jgi:glucose-1-phosphate thymidylyltransferase
MKGIILAGGKGTRLRPLTKITSKQLLPVYDKPMIFYPLNTLLKAGITEILIIIAPDYAGHFLHLLGSGKEFGAKFTYEIQEEATGLSSAFIIGDSFIGDDSVALILGDNIFEDDLTDMIQNFKSGGRVAAIEVTDPERFGVVEFDETGKVISIEEKPKNPKSNYAIPGIYIYDSKVVQFAKELKPSDRGELEIVDLHKKYLDLDELDVVKLNGKWFDTGTFDSLLEAANWVKEKKK